MKKQVKCPNCESYKTRRGLNGSGVESVLGKFMIAGGCLSGLLFLILFPPFLLLSFLVFCIGAGVANFRDLLAGVERFDCRSCGIQFTVAKA